MTREGGRVGRALLAPAGRGDAIAVTVALILGIVVCLRLGRGYFLADDFVQLANFADWQSQGRLADEVLLRFHDSIDGVNGFFRPLTFLTYAANYLVSGAKAPAWLAVNLALHLANAVLTGMLVARLAGQRTRAVTAAALFAAAFFFVFAPVWEVATWIACRYDALATFFTLLSGVWFIDGRRMAALAATMAALLSKESGAGAIILVALLAAGGFGVRRDGSRVRAWVLALAPWVAAGAVYTVLRWAMFGSATEVYHGIRPQLFSSEHWRLLGSSARTWGHAVFPGMPGLTGLAVLSAATFAAGGLLAVHRGLPAVRALGVVAAMLLAALALLLPHFTGFEGNGIGGRLFYQPAAFYAAGLGLAVHEGLAAWNGRRAMAAIALAAAFLLFAANLQWGAMAARDYASAQRSMREAAAAIRRLGSDAATGHALVVVPDAVGRVPFGRNAQAGLMLPPVQPAPLNARLVVQTDAEIATVDRLIDGGKLAAVSAMPLSDYLAGRASGRAWPRLVPDRIFCWNPWRRELLALDVPDPGPGRYAEPLAAAYAAACGAKPPARP